MRILMRGIKIGKKKGGEKISIMSIFEKKAAPKAAATPKEWLKILYIKILN